MLIRLMLRETVAESELHFRLTRRTRSVVDRLFVESHVLFVYSLQQHA
jgi:hypothetical protein